MTFPNHEPQPLWPNGAPGLNDVDPSFNPTITPYLIESDRPLGCVVVCPGGGYGHRAPHEGEPIALARESDRRPSLEGMPCTLPNGEEAIWPYELEQRSFQDRLRQERPSAERSRELAPT
jgi:hypothetical protein